MAKLPELVRQPAQMKALQRLLCPSYSERDRVEAAAMAKRNKSSASLIPSDLGFHSLVFDKNDIVHLLRAAVEREGSQTAFASRHGVDRAYVNMILNGKRPVSDAIAKALGLRKVYVAK